MKYTMRDEAGTEQTVEAATLAEVRKAAKAWVLEGDWDTSDGTLFEGVRIEDEDGDYVETVRVAIHPDEPDCADGYEHDWRSPHAVVGGLKENPGVFGHGGGTISHAVCRHCACHRVTDTWAQDNSGRQGLTSVRYETASETVRDAEEHYRRQGQKAADDAEPGAVVPDQLGALAAAAYVERMAERVVPLEDT